LLDTYHAERHPVGQRLMTLTRAQEALARPGEHITALRELFGRLLTQEQTLRTIVEEITDVDIRYEMGADGGGRDPLLGMWAPNLALHTDNGISHVAGLMCAGKGVLIDVTATSALRDVAAKWTDRIQVIAGRCDDRPANLDAMLVRPDGYVAWVGRSGDRDECEKTLGVALEKWFGAAQESACNSPDFQDGMNWGRKGEDG
jgi:hypothetical protein